MKNTKPTVTLTPKWMAVQTAADWSGFSDRHIEELARTGQIVSSNVIQEGKSRGRSLILVSSLDDYIMAGIDRPPAQLAMNADRGETQHEKSYLHNGKLMTIAQLCAISTPKLTVPALRYRLNQGWAIDRALTEPLASRAEAGKIGAGIANELRSRKIVFNGEVAAVADMARKAGISPRTASARIRRGWKPEDAVSQPLKRAPSQTPKQFTPLPNEPIIAHAPGIVQHPTSNSPYQDAPTEPPPELIDRHEAARRLSLSVRTIDELIASGDLYVVRIGRTVRIRPSAIAYFVEARETRGRIKSKRASETDNVNQRGQNR